MANTRMADLPTLELLLKEAPWLRRLAGHLVDDRDEAADIAQETLIAAVRAAPATDRPLRPWLARVAANLARRRARGAGRRDRREVAAATEGAAAPLADTLLERMQLQRIVAEEVMALEEPGRAAVLLHYYEGLSSAEVGRALGEPEGTVRWRLKEARGRLRAALDRRCPGGRAAWVAALAPAGWTPRATPGTQAAAKIVAVGLVVGALGVAGVLALRRGSGAGEGARGYAWTAPAGPRLKIFGAPTPAPTGALGGLVKHADGAPAAGVVVTARRREGRDGAARADTVLSAKDGGFAFPSLADGAYDVTATAADALSVARGPVEVRGGQAVHDLVLTFASGGFLLSGALTDAAGGPLPGSVIQARAGESAFSAIADEHGRYQLRLAKASYRLRADADGYAPRQGNVDLVGDMIRDLRLDPAGHLVGIVVDAASNGPVAGAIVRAESNEVPPALLHATSDGAGRFAFLDLAPGEYLVSARAGARVAFRSGRVAVGVARETDAGTLALAAAYEIAGRVTADGRPVAGSRIFVDDVLMDKGAFGGTALATTAADGRYVIEGVAPGRMRVRAGGVLPWAPSGSELVEVKDASIRRDFVLPAGGTVRAQVLGADGQPAPDAAVTIEMRGSQAGDALFRGNGRAVTDEAGRFFIAGLGAGHVFVEIVDRRWGRLMDEQLRLGPGETKEATLTFPPPASIAGSVSWDDGTPAAGVRVVWNPWGRGGREPQAITDKAGRFQLAPCSPRTGVVQAEQPTDRRSIGGFAAPHQRKLELTPGAAVSGVALVLARNDRTITGVVLDPQGRPLADASVGAEDGAANPRWLPHRSENVVRSDGEGRFRLERLTRGRYVVWATHADFPEVNRPEVEAGAAGVSLRFAASASVGGVVRDEAGAPARLYTLVLVPAEGPGRTNGWGSGWLIGREEKVNDAGGAFRLDRVAPGAYDLLVTAPDGRVARAGNVVLDAGEEKLGLALVLRAAVTLRGRAVDSESGAPLAGARVVVMGTREHVHATTDEAGAFALAGQIPGRTLLVRVQSLRDYIPAEREVAVPGERETELRPFRVLAAKSLPAGMDLREAGDPGLRLVDRGEGPVIDRVLPGTPAARLGLKPGERILAVGGRDVSGLDSFAATMLLRGAPGSTVEVNIAGGGGARKVALGRAAP